MEEIIERNKFLMKIRSFLNSQLFVILSTLVAFFAYKFKLEFVEFAYVALSLIAICFLCKDSKPILPLMLTVVFSISLYHSPANYNTIGDQSYFVSGWRLLATIVIIAICALSLLVKLFIFKQAEAVFFRRRALTLGFIAFTVALCLNGITSGFNLGNFGFGLIEGLTFLIIYTYFINTLGENIDYSYFCKVCVVVSFLLMAELAQIVIQTVNANGQIDKANIVFGWGISNNIGGIFALLIAPCAYLAYSSKKYPFYILVMLMCFVGVIFSLSRSALLASIIIFPICCILLIVKGKYRLGNTIALLSSLLIIVICFNLFSEQINQIFIYYSKAKLDDSGRFAIYKEGLLNFIKKPIFGVGFSYQINGFPSGNIMLNMYHNTIIQTLASCGLVGLFCFVWNQVESFRLFLVKFTIKRTFMFLSIFAVVVTSLLDNAYFYFYPMFFYILNFVFLEKDVVNEQKGCPRFNIPKGKKPRVLIPLVEAGMGHITSALAIAEAMQNKYGDELEILCIPFFGISGSKLLERFEKKLVSFVIIQNKIPGFGKASLMATGFFGRKVSLKYVMESHVPNTFETAMNYIESFDADMIISTHWSTSYYAWRLKKRPIVVNYCPDATFNLMFDTGEDLLLISTQNGADKAKKDRFNYKSEIKKVPFCLRKEVFAVSNDTLENRRKNGIGENAWTVVLADGGYGAGKLESVVNALLKADLPITIIPVAGKNQKLYQRFLKKKVGKNTNFMPMGFVENLPEIISCANLFIGKSGAMTMAEPCYFGVPTIVSYCATPIERDIAAFYTDSVKSSVRLYTTREIVNAVKDYLIHPEKLNILHKNALKIHSEFGAEKTADILYQFYKEKTNNTLS